MKLSQLLERVSVSAVLGDPSVEITAVTADSQRIMKANLFCDSNWIHVSQLSSVDVLRFFGCFSRMSYIQISDVTCLERETDPGRDQGDGVNGLLHDRHHLVPLALDRGEHGVGPVRQARGPDDTNSFGDGVPDGVTGPDGGDREGYEHEPILPGPPLELIYAWD